MANNVYKLDLFNMKMYDLTTYNQLVQQNGANVIDFITTLQVYNDNLPYAPDKNNYVSPFVIKDGSAYYGSDSSHSYGVKIVNYIPLVYDNGSNSGYNLQQFLYLYNESDQAIKPDVLGPSSSAVSLTTSAQQIYNSVMPNGPVGLNSSDPTNNINYNKMTDQQVSDDVKKIVNAPIPMSETEKVLLFAGIGTVIGIGMIFFKRKK